MPRIFVTRRNERSGNVFIHFEGAGVRKLSGEEFAFAKQFHNSEFLCAVSHDTSERNLVDSYYAKEFKDPDLVYSEL